MSMFYEIRRCGHITLTIQNKIVKPITYHVLPKKKNLYRRQFLQSLSQLYAAFFLISYHTLEVNREIKQQ